MVAGDRLAVGEARHDLVGEIPPQIEVRQPVIVISRTADVFIVGAVIEREIVVRCPPDPGRDRLGRNRVHLGILVAQTGVQLEGFPHQFGIPDHGNVVGPDFLLDRVLSQARGKCGIRIGRCQKRPQNGCVPHESRIRLPDRIVVELALEAVGLDHAGCKFVDVARIGHAPATEFLRAVAVCHQNLAVTVVHTSDELDRVPVKRITQIHLIELVFL